MRHSFLCKWLIPLSAIVISCAQEKEIEQFERRDLVISASQEPAGTEDPETRTVLVGEQNVYWTASDKILVFSGGQSAEFTSRNNSAAATAEFSGTIAIPTSSASDPYIRALYPYNSNASLAGGSITTILPSSQTGVAGTFDDDLIILASRATVSSSSSGTVTVPMTFDHLCAGIRFSLTRDDITKVVLTAVGGESLAGKFTFNWNNSGVPGVSSVINSSSSITLNPPPGQSTFTPGVWYYIVTLPVTEFSQGVKFTLTNSSNQTAERLLGQVTSFSLAKGSYKSATDLDDPAHVTFDEGGGDEPGPDEPDVEVQIAGPDTWVATDELHRVAPTAITDENVPAARDNRKVLMFYSDWHTDHQVDYPSIVNVTGIKWFYPEALNNSNNANWGFTLAKRNQILNDGDPSNDWQVKYYPQACFWGQPLFGYYRTTDPWVLRKHAEMLADAGVDAVFFDCTNGEFLWLSSLKALLETWSQAKRDGVNVPKIGFVLQLSIQPVTEREALYMLYYGTTFSNTSEYDKNSPLLGFYGRGEYSDLWFYLDGDTKPLIMAYPSSLDMNNAYDKAIYDFFTWRPGQGSYVYGDTNADSYATHQWGWLQNYPQHSFNKGEQMTVGVAQNASDDSGGHCFAFNSPDTYGRSYTKAHGNQNLVEATEPGEVASFKYGYNFQEQWDYAIEKDPHYIFVTQWNEWIALKNETWPPAGSPQGSYGYPNAPGYSFADQFDSERSRDIEPTANWGDNGDNYYYQLVQNVRRYKGVSAYPNVTRKRTMEIDGDFTGWDEVSPDFKHYPGNTLHRNHLGHSNSGLKYTNSTGRNDFVDARVTRDDEYVYFYVETNEAITSRSDANWMRLLINIDRNIETGWKGYDYCLNYLNPTSDSQGIASHATSTGWEWEDAGIFDYAVNGNKMEIRVPRSVLGLTASDKLDFEFKWADNNLVDRMSDDPQVTRILSLYVDGDAAPGGRFNFHYKEPVD